MSHLNWRGRGSNTTNTNTNTKTNFVNDALKNTFSTGNSRWTKKPDSTLNAGRPFEKKSSDLFQKNSVSIPSIPKNNRRWELTDEDQKRRETQDVFQNTFEKSSNSGTDSVTKPKKSFNKKIHIIDTYSQKEEEQRKKAIYDSFIKDSFILKKEKSVEKAYIINDAWDSDKDSDNLFIEKKTEWDIWLEMNGHHFQALFDKIDTEINKKTQIIDKMDKTFYAQPSLTTYNVEWYVRKQLLCSEMIDIDKQELLWNFYKNTNMTMSNFIVKYSINRLIRTNGDEIKKQYQKLRKKINDIKKIEKKQKNGDFLHKAQADKLKYKLEVEFLYQQLKYYLNYYLEFETG
jgi:hypothetical protein